MSSNPREEYCLPEIFLRVIIITMEDQSHQASNHEVSPTGCCPKFNPDPWQGRRIEWKDKDFVKDGIKSIFHIPLNVSSKIRRNTALIEKSGATVPGMIMLFDENSLWDSDLYIETSREVAGVNNVKFSGKFITKAFEGSYSSMGGWIKEMGKYLASIGVKPLKYYFYYTTCPKCAKAYGKNYTVIFARVE